MTTSEYIKIKTTDSKDFSSYLSKPPSGKGPGLLLIQEIFGVNSHIREVADLYAQEGFVVLAPDLFWRQETSVELKYNDEDFAKGFALATKMNTEQALSDLGDAVTNLKGLPFVTGKIASIGYCFGGQLSYRLVCRGKVDAAVSYYGGGIDQALDEAKTLHCPLLMHFAEIDKYISPDAISKIRGALSSKADISINTYANVHHGFNCDQRQSYNRQASMLAYSRSAAFLHKYIG